MAVITFAHRGARLVEPENTIPAFRVALDQGATGIETDVWLSADGEVVCAHDPFVSRGLRRRKTLAASTAASSATLGIPRFADVYEELGTEFECSVDVKTADAADGLVEVARAYDALERLWVCSPDVDAPDPAPRRRRERPGREARALRAPAARSARRSSGTRSTSRRRGSTP